MINRLQKNCNKINIEVVFQLYQLTVVHRTHNTQTLNDTHGVICFNCFKL